MTTLMVWLAIQASAQTPALPGAEGWGAMVSGGRSGDVHIVTTLAATGPGSLQWAVDQPGPRVVVFEVSGVIQGDVEIGHGDLTIAGQTAPGAGLTIDGHLYTPYGTQWGNVVVRHLRVRPPSDDWPPTQHDAVQLSANTGLMFDHVDFSHGIDEILDLWAGAQQVSVQWSALTFPVYGGGHSDGPDHNYGMINGPGGGRISVHHTLFAHAKSRTPALAEGPADVVNNVVYNGREGFVHHNPAAGDFNIVGNFYRDGPSESLAPYWFDPENYDPPTRYFVSANFVDDPGVYVGLVDDPFSASQEFRNAYTSSCCGIDSGNFVSTPFDWGADSDYVPITTQPVKEGGREVLACAGAWPRDALNKLAVREVKERSGSYGDRRPPSWMHGLTPGQPPADLDRDGMADSWEVGVGLDPTDPTDHATVVPNGYTAVEIYINQLADALTPC